jgi:phosphotransferase system enzyme I (PtsI)
MLCANLDLPEEVESVLEYGGQGVGLFRTEYFFISQDYLPSEDEQYKMYRSVAEKLGDRPVTFRTIDIGGDKIVGYLNNATELNPFMGWRGIRFCLARKDIFKAQLRALYRTSAHGNIKIMFPMIAQIEEVIQAKEICNEVQVELKRGRYKFDPNVELGVMIETPSAVVMADAMAKEVDFFSIGTNDLIQYTLAVDRGNSRISHLYQNLHPSIIRSLKTTVEAAHKKKIHVGVCGEMCVDPLSVLVLIGLAIDEFSTSANMIPEVKRIIRSVTYDECKSLVRRVLRYRTTSEIEREIEEFLKARVPSSPGVNGISK